LEPFWPNEIIKMICAVLVTMAVIMFFAVLPVLLEVVGLTGVSEMEVPADPRVTPPNIRPEWYFLSVYQYLKLMPSQLAGIEGAALGVLSQGIGVALLLLLPFWYKLDIKVRADGGFGRGLKYFLIACVLLVLSGAAVAALNLKYNKSVGVLFHPAFWRPALAVVSWLIAYVLGRRAGFTQTGHWLLWLTVMLLLVLFQGITLIVVLGQGLSHVIGSAGYAIGGALFIVVVAWILWVAGREVRRQDKVVRRRLFIFTITENVILFLGLMLWAKWPHHELFEASGEMSHEFKQFVFLAVVVVAAVIVFSLLVRTEVRNIRRVLGPSSETEGSA